MIRLSFQGIQNRHVVPNAEELSPSRFAVNHVSGLFCNGSAKYAQGRCPDRAAQGASPIFRASLVQTGLWPPPLRSGGETPPLAPCYPRLRQVAFGMYMPRFNAESAAAKTKEKPP